jgi:hypothetical protein
MPVDYDDPNDIAKYRSKDDLARIIWENHLALKAYNSRHNATHAVRYVSIRGAKWSELMAFGDSVEIVVTMCECQLYFATRELEKALFAVEAVYYNIREFDSRSRSCCRRIKLVARDGSVSDCCVISLEGLVHFARTYLSNSASDRLPERVRCEADKVCTDLFAKMELEPYGQQQEEPELKLGKTDEIEITFILQGNESSVLAMEKVTRTALDKELEQCMKTDPTAGYAVESMGYRHETKGGWHD